MSTSGKFLRGDIVLLPIAFVSGRGTKVRPAVVVQSDSLNVRLQSTMIAVVTSNTSRAAVEPTQLLIDLSTPDGQKTGLLRNSTIKCEHIDTVDQADIVKKIGVLPAALLAKLDDCLKAALEIA
jgi:mRNA interferase MazF